MNRSLSSATKWLSSTAYKLFSSSNESSDSTSSNESKDSIYSTQSTPIVSNANVIKRRGRGRPSKTQKTTKTLATTSKTTATTKKRRQNMTFHRELLALKQVTKSRTRSSANSSASASIEQVNADDTEVRYLLTFKALPSSLRVIAQLLHPVPQSCYEEHRLACRLLSENNSEVQTRRDEIAIPTFKRLDQLRSVKEAEKTAEKELITDDACLHRHRPLELAERRERRREEELLRYEEYIRKLSREYPELLNRKYSFSGSSSSM